MAASGVTETDKGLSLELSDVSEKFVVLVVLHDHDDTLRG